MSDKKTDGVNRMILILTAVYTASYLCRFSYATVLPELVAVTGKTKTELSVAVTCLFICYGAGQIVSGILGDRLPPKYLIFTGLFVSGCLNFILPFIGLNMAVVIIWGINGFMQSLLWSPIVGVMVSVFSHENYMKGSLFVTFGGFFGQILLYVLAPLLIHIWSWRAVFWFGGTVATIISLIFFFVFPNIAPTRKRVGNRTGSALTSDEKSVLEERGAIRLRGTFSVFLTPWLFPVMLCILTQGFIRDGITTWMPTYVSELFQFGAGASILTGVLLPVFAIICNKLTNILNRKKLTNPLTCTSALFIGGALLGVILFALNKSAAVLTVFISALFAGCMHGVNLMLLCMIPPFFKSSGNVSAISGLLNATAYAGSSISAYELALLSENISWQWLFLILAGISALAGFIAFAIKRVTSTPPRDNGLPLGNR